MTTSAIIMMVLAMLLIWGGLVLAIINLVKRGNPPVERIGEDSAHRDL